MCTLYFVLSMMLIKNVPLETIFIQCPQKKNTGVYTTCMNTKAFFCEQGLVNVNKLLDEVLFFFENIYCYTLITNNKATKIFMTNLYILILSCDCF